MDDTTSTRDRRFEPLPTGPSCVIGASQGRFEATELEPIVSSARKLVFRGTWSPRGDGAPRSAVAIVFPGDDTTHYGSEVAALARSGVLSVGPQVIDPACRMRYEGSLRPAIVEEDAGVSLEDAVFDCADIPGTLGHPEWHDALRPLGTPERRVENRKILFDIYTQVSALHAAGLYHRDIRLANICVRRHGPLPRDIRATLIDHELETDYRGSDVPAAALRYDRALFGALPKTMCDKAEAIRPTSLLRDLGYLAALRFELCRGIGIQEATPEDIVCGSRPYFFYAQDGRPCGHALDPAGDISPLAVEAGLTSISDSPAFSPQALTFIQTHIKHGGFLDACDRERIREREGSALEGMADTLAREVIFPRWLRERASIGKPPEYATFDEQPAVLQESNRDQARDIPRKLQALGYRIEPLDGGDLGERVTAFSPDELEYLAYLEHRRWMDERLRAGWVHGPVRDDARRIHPDLVPYDELTEASRELDRSAVGEIISILEIAGMGVYR